MRTSHFAKYSLLYVKHKKYILLSVLRTSVVDQWKQRSHFMLCSLRFLSLVHVLEKATLSLTNQGEKERVAPCRRAAASSASNDARLSQHQARGNRPRLDAAYAMYRIYMLRVHAAPRSAIKESDEPRRLVLSKWSHRIGCCVYRRAPGDCVSGGRPRANACVRSQESPKFVIEVIRSELASDTRVIHRVRLSHHLWI